MGRPAADPVERALKAYGDLTAAQKETFHHVLRYVADVNHKMPKRKTRKPPEQVPEQAEATPAE